MLTYSVEDHYRDESPDLTAKPNSLRVRTGF